MRPKDPAGYYAALGLDLSATSDEIKKAFKAKAQEFHPDRNPAPEATRLFQLINDAYQILGDPEKRARYDADSYGPPRESDSITYGAVEPILCSRCQRVTAQPRYCIYRYVVSAVFVTWRAGHQGIFCAACGATSAYKASLKTWLLGWWGIPWGPIYSIQAIVRNMLGGEHPALNNFRILSCQSLYFARVGRMDLARAVAREALRFGKRIHEHEGLHDAHTSGLVETLKRIVAEGGEAESTRIFKRAWGYGSRAFKIQLSTAAAIALFVIGVALSSGIFHPPRAYRHVPPVDISTPVSEVRAADPDHSRPAAAEQTRFSEPVLPLPTTGRIRALGRNKGERILAPLKIVTASGSPNYYVKVLDWATHAAKLVLFVRSGETATVRIPSGIYELRYAAGETWYGEEYLFGPRTAYAKASKSFDFHTEGDRVLGFTVELIKQANGNLREVPIPASQF